MTLQIHVEVSIDPDPATDLMNMDGESRHPKGREGMPVVRIGCRSLTAAV